MTRITLFVIIALLAAVAAQGQTEGPGQPGKPVLVGQSTQAVVETNETVGAAEDIVAAEQDLASMVGAFTDGNRVTLHGHFARPGIPGQPVRDGETPRATRSIQVYLGVGETLRDSEPAIDQGEVLRDEETEFDGYFLLSGSDVFTAGEVVTIFFSRDGISEVLESILFEVPAGP